MKLTMNSWMCASGSKQSWICLLAVQDEIAKPVKYKIEFLMLGPESYSKEVSPYIGPSQQYQMIGVESWYHFRSCF